MTDDSEKQVTTVAHENRTQFSNWLEFMLSCMGFSIGLGNVWRFPYKAYENGGGAFLIPYVIVLFCAGIPLYYMELCLGQFSSMGPITAWNCIPMFKGIGYGMVVVSTFVCIYYNVVIAWIFYYLIASVRAALPWDNCYNSWNTDTCDVALRNCQHANGSMVGFNCEFNLNLNSTQLNDLNTVEWESPEEQYWTYSVIQQSSGIDEPGRIVWPLFFCLLLSWCLMVACLVRGITTSGKVVYFTVLAPYALLIVFLIRAVTLEGYYKGVEFFITPKWEMLKTAKVWSEATTQIFYSLGVGFGGIITMASYNKFRNNCLRDAILISLLNCSTSVFAGFIIFSILGHMASQQGVEVEDIIRSGGGPGLAFIAYPSAVSLIPVSPLWAVLFFLMLLLLGLDSQFAMYETVITSLVDQFPRLRKHNTAFMIICSVFMFMLGIPMVTEGGIYVFNMYDTFSAGFSIMLLGLVECLVICWGYGWRNFSIDIKSMLGFDIGILFKFCWFLLSPGLILFIAVFSFIGSGPFTYGTYVYPVWAAVLGWCMMFLSFAMIPLCIALQCCRASGGIGQRWRTVSRPNANWGPMFMEDKQHWLRVRQRRLGVATPADKTFDEI